MILPLTSCNNQKYYPPQIIGCWSAYGDDMHYFKKNMIYFFEDGQFLYTKGYSGGGFHFEDYKGTYTYDATQNEIVMLYTHRHLATCLAGNFTNSYPQKMKIDDSFQIMEGQGEGIKLKTDKNKTRSITMITESKYKKIEIEESEMAKISQGITSSTDWETVSDPK